MALERLFSIFNRQESEAERSLREYASRLNMMNREEIREFGSVGDKVDIENYGKYGLRVRVYDRGLERKSFLVTATKDGEIVTQPERIPD